MTNNSNISSIIVHVLESDNSVVNFYATELWHSTPTNNTTTLFLSGGSSLVFEVVGVSIVVIWNVALARQQGSYSYLSIVFKVNYLSETDWWLLWMDIWIKLHLGCSLYGHIHCDIIQNYCTSMAHLLVLVLMWHSDVV